MRKVFPFLNKKDNMSSSSKNLSAPSNSKEISSEINSNKNLGGSATGNPRNKCALKPGHSLIDWIRLGTSGVDLAGTKGVITPVNNEELAKHCKENDAWTAIRGKVYNVTQYMEFHPGGIEELRKGFGKDATQLFNEVHAWVNYEQLLAKCFVGPLRNIVQVDLEPIKPRQKSTTPTPDCAENSKSNILLQSNDDDSFRKPMFPIRLSNSERTSPVKTLSPTDNFVLNDLKDVIDEKRGQKSAAEMIPRFDWIQNTSDITLIFYTRPFLNPGLVISYKSFTIINIRIFIGFIMHEFNFELHNQINWPCTAKISKETGKIEIFLKKMKPQLWTIYGNIKHEKTYKNSYDYTDEYDFQIEKCEKFNHDSFALILKSCDNVLILTPIGYHLSLTAKVDNEPVTRSYTPVPLSYLLFQTSNVSYKIGMLIKSYINGKLAKYITGQMHNQLKIKLSAPKGNFSLIKLLEHNRIALLAAGSGITPLLGILEHLLFRNNNKIQHVELLFFNKTEKDIWCKDELAAIKNMDDRLKIRHILSEADDSWSGEKGRLSEELIKSLNDNSRNSFVTYCCVCGPTPFNELASKLLIEANISSEQTHFFQG